MAGGLIKRKYGKISPRWRDKLARGLGMEIK